MLNPQQALKTRFALSRENGQAAAADNPSGASDGDIALIFSMLDKTHCH